jgi:hydrogenase nickel incorporation protein HypA/HybF
MHELSIAEALVEEVEALRVAHGGNRVISIDVRVGEWRQVVPEILVSYFDHLTAGTPLEGTRIDIERVVTTVRCEDCHKVFELDDILLFCPECGSRACTLLTGRELELVGLELDD